MSIRLHTHYRSSSPTNCKPADQQHRPHHCRAGQTNRRRFRTCRRCANDCHGWCNVGHRDRLAIRCDSAVTIIHRQRHHVGAVIVRRKAQRRCRSGCIRTAVLRHRPTVNQRIGGTGHVIRRTSQTNRRRFRACRRRANDCHRWCTLVTVIVLLSDVTPPSPSSTVNVTK